MDVGACGELGNGKLQRKKKNMSYIMRYIGGKKPTANINDALETLWFFHTIL